jgi:flavin-dependent dehydrogenase
VYDAIVVGARCAGSPTAMLLARKGYRVLLLDKAGFPSDTLSTHYLHQPGVGLLARWGLLERLAASNCPPIRGYHFDVGPFALEGAPPAADGFADAYAPRRSVLDKILVDAAVAAGAELREHFSAQELLTDGERVTGIRGHASGGAMVTEEAPIVIGADGLRSLVARSVQAPTYHRNPALTCAYYAYWGDIPIQCVELYPRPGRMVIAFPTHDGQVLIVVQWPHAAFHEFRADVEGNYLKTLDLAPALAERVRRGRRSERFLGTADLPNLFRRPHGPGWALVGDAGYYEDPQTAMGMTNAFRDAELLAEAIDAGFAEGGSLAESLAEYGRRRDEAAVPYFEYTCQLARMAPPSPEMQRLFAALRENRDQTDRFFGTIAGTVPVSEFFAPENLAGIPGVAGGVGR